MNKSGKGEFMLGALIVLFLGVVVVLALFPSIAENQKVMTDKLYSPYELHGISSARYGANNVNESITFTLTHVPSSSDWQAVGGDLSCALSSFKLGNGTVNFTVTTDYVVNTSAFTYTMKNSTATVGSTTNNTYAYYYYCDDGYVGDQAAGTMAKLILVFAALGLFGFVVWGALSEGGWLRS